MPAATPPHDRPGEFRHRLNDAELQRLVREADVVIGTDPATGATWDLFISRPTDGRPARVVRLELDGSTDDPEAAGALVRRIKGRLDATVERRGTDKQDGTRAADDGAGTDD